MICSMLAAVAQPLSVAEPLGTFREPRDAAVLTLMAQGLAPGEVRQLNIDDVDPVAGQLLVRGGGHGRPRSVTLRPDTRAALMSYLAVRPVVATVAMFLSSERRRLAARTLRTIARRHGVNASGMRQSYIRKRLAAGVTPRQLCNELGVASLYGMLKAAPRPQAKPRVVVISRFAGGWDPAALRQWVLETLEKQLEAWNLKGYQRIPASFAWPPLPPADLRKLATANGNITTLITIILEKLMA